MPWIASRLFPLVSGTKRRQNKNVSPVMPPNTQKEPASVRTSTIVEKHFVTRKAKVQLKQVAMEEARPRTSGENSSDIINQGMGPNPTLKAITKIDNEAKGTICSLVARAVLSSLNFM